MSGADPERHGRPDDWLRETSDVRYAQFLGKDNVPFHTLSFPATLIGARENWKTVDVVKGLHWLTYEGGKFSTSGRRGVFLDRALDILPADGWRWWLCANSPEGSDTDFTFARLAEGLNADLADNLGNLVNRVLRYLSTRHEGTVPTDVEADENLIEELDRRLEAIRAAHEAVEIRRCANEVRSLWSFVNAHVARHGPWLTARSDPTASARSAATAVALVRLCALVAWPFVPAIARIVLDAVGEAPGDPVWKEGGSRVELATVAAGTPVTVPPVIFAKLDAQWVATKEAAFAGDRSGFPAAPL